MDYDVNNSTEVNSAANGEDITNEEKQVPKKPAIKKRKFLILAAIAVALIAIAIVAIVILNSPTVVAKITLKNAASDFLDRGEIKPFIKTATGGSIKASVEDVKIINGDDEDMLLDGSISGKIYFSKDALMLSDVKAEIDDFKASGDAYISKNLIYVNENEILNGAYGINISTLADDLADSIFAPDSGSDYELDEDVYDKIIKLSENLAGNSKFEKDMEKLVKTVFGDIFEIVLDNVEISSKKDKIRIGDAKKSVRVITITIDGFALENIIEEVYAYLCESDDVIEFIDKHEDIILLLMGSYYADYYYDGNYDSLSELYLDILKDYEDNIDDMCEEASDLENDIKLMLATPKAQAKLLKVELSFNDENIISADFGAKGVKKSNSISVTLGNDSKLTYNVTKNNSKSLIAKLELTSNKVKNTVSVNIDKKNEKYSIELDHSYEGTTYYNGKFYDYVNTDRYSIKGSYKTKGDTTTLTVDKITNKYESDCENNKADYSYTSTIKMNATIVMDTKDKIPKPMKDFKIFADITEKKLNEIIEDIENLF